MAKINYLNNKDLLREIHKSKITYCSFSEKTYSEFDFIVQDKGEITQELIDRIRTTKATKLKVSEDQIPVEGFVIRVMTNEHIPDDLINGKRNKGKSKTNFPPFKHYLFKDSGIIEVGRSHWKGTPETGGFSTGHGKISNELAKMFMKLVERYGSKGNWRGYTYLDEMRSNALLQLSMVGLQFNESRSENPFAYYTMAVKNSFRRILNEEKKNQKIRDDILIMSGAVPSMTRQVDNEMEQKAEWIQVTHAKTK